jgi:cell division protease FtsH
VHKISIVPRGRALGYTLNLPAEDRYLKTRDELVDYMTVLLGGRTAEAIVFGSITTGASDDLKRVAEISRSMVHEYAMGTGLNSQRVTVEGDELSDMTRQMRDQEQRDLADEAYRAAYDIVQRHRDRLDELAHTLLANEVLEREDIDRIMAGVPRIRPEPGVPVELAAAADPEARDRPA